MKDVLVTFPLDGAIALIAAGSTPMRKIKGERDTEFVKRIVGAYCASLIVAAAMDAALQAELRGRSAASRTDAGGV